MSDNPDCVGCPHYKDGICTYEYGCIVQVENIEEEERFNSSCHVCGSDAHTLCNLNRESETTIVYEIVDFSTSPEYAQKKREEGYIIRAHLFKRPREKPAIHISVDCTTSFNIHHKEL